MSKATKRHRPQHAPAVERKADEMIAKLREYHRLGTECNELETRRERREFAYERAISPNTMRKARSFARHYTERELDELCRLRKPDGIPFHFGFIPYFLTVHPKKERKKIQRQAAERGWTAPELNAHIQQMRGGPQCGGGRPMKKPATLEAGLERITADGNLWIRRCELVLGDVDDHTLAGDLRDRAEEALVVLRAVEKTARSAAKAMETALGSAPKTRRR